ncbi:DUF3089 domain-containing protein [Flavobacteriales bacterium]|nr:DUF3089 domain-containing protein [Flavobacteriales bacterium]
MNTTKLLLLLSIISLYSCGLKKKLNYSSSFLIPNQNFKEDSIKLDLDYSDEKNWAFRSDIHNFKKIIPKNYSIKNEKKLNVSVFYIHPTTLFSSLKWNADTTHFVNNEIIDLCLENQASVFAGITDLYVPHYREMHIYSYTDTINGLKAFNFAYNDIQSSFEYFLQNIETDKFIIASHSQGTNHAKKLINEYIYPNKKLRSKLVISYLIGMDIYENEMLIDLCQNPVQLDCFLNWRSFNESYYPDDWNYGDNFISINPITFKNDTVWSNKNQHKGILFPNQRILFNSSLSVKNEKGLAWIKFYNNIFLNKFKKNSYHNADFNLFWINIRQNLIKRFN